MREAHLGRWWPHATSVLALLAVRPVASLSPSPAAPPPPPIFVPQLVPIRVPSPPPPPVVITTIAAPRDQLACPKPPRADDAVYGAQVRPASFDDGPHALIAASAAAPVIALVRADGGARVSVDDGRAFAGAFAGEVVSSITVDDRGRVYAIVGGRLGVRDLRGREQWIDAATPARDTADPDRVVAAGDAVAWIHGGTVRTSRDGGRSWHVIDDEPGDELASATRLGYWRGAIYGVSHVSDMCGWEADQLARLDVATHAYTFESFDNAASSPKLEVVGDTGATWTYHADVHGDASARDLRLASIAPAFGPRLLWAAEGQLYELCGAHGRIVAHGYGAPRVDAVDAAGRPLIAEADRVFRWSARFGWRELDPQFEEPAGAGD